jgi:hypothetical protein
MPSNDGGVVTFVCVLGLAILIFGSISFGMTAKNRVYRMWGCRLAAALFFLAGAGFIAAAASGVTTRKPGYVWAVVMFGISGWQWRQASK